MDKVRRQEHKALRAMGDSVLTGSKYICLTNREPMSAKQKKQFLKTSRAWAFKEIVQNLWNDVTHLGVQMDHALLAGAR